MKLAHNPGLSTSSVVRVQRAFGGGLVEGHDGVLNSLPGRVYVAVIDVTSGISYERSGAGAERLVQFALPVRHTA